MKSFLSKHKWKLLLAFIIFIVAIPLGINSLFKLTSPLDIFVAEWEAGDALAFYGVMLASATTIIGVYISIEYAQRNYRVDEANRVKPYLALTHYIIKSVAEKLSSLSYIEGIVLGGSRARGTHTEDSDIDIGIYYNSESFDINTINQFATKLDDEHRNNLVVPPGAWGDWINGGGWLVINGYHVDLILRDIKRVEQIMKDTEHGIVTANYQTGHPHGYISAMYRGELAISKILYAKNESLCELKKQAETYPNALQKSLVNFFMFEAGFSLMFVKANSGTDDKYYIAGHVFRIVSCLNQVLFA